MRARSTPARRPPPCGRTCSPASGSRSPPPGRTASSCRRPTATRSRRRPPSNPSEVPDALRRRRLREPLPVVRARRSATPDSRELDDRAARPRAHPPVGRPLRGRLLQPRARGLVRHARRVARPHRDRGVGRPHRGALGAAGHRAGLPVREPRRGDRRDAAPPARPDLRLPLRHARARSGCWTSIDRSSARPVRSASSTSSSASASASCSAASTGPRSCRSPPAGRSRCTCCRTGRCPTSPRRATRSATSSPRLYLRLLRGIDALYDTPTPYIAAWHQAPVHVGARRHPAACCS